MNSRTIIYVLFCLFILPNLVQPNDCNRPPTLEGVSEADNQCRKLGCGYARMDADTCKELRCAYQGLFNWDGLLTFWTWQNTGIPVVEGGACGVGFHCQSGKCAAIPGWSPPEYIPLTKYERRQLALKATTPRADDC